MISCYNTFLNHTFFFCLFAVKRTRFYANAICGKTARFYANAICVHLCYLRKNVLPTFSGVFLLAQGRYLLVTYTLSHSSLEIQTPVNNVVCTIYFSSGRAEANFRWGYLSKYQKIYFAKLSFIFKFLLYKTPKRWGYLGTPGTLVPLSLFFIISSISAWKKWKLSAQKCKMERIEFVIGSTTCLAGCCRCSRNTIESRPPIVPIAFFIWARAVMKRTGEHTVITPHSSPFNTAFMQDRDESM